MALIGIIEEKKGNTATILVKKVLPCGDKCKNCSAGCNLYNIHIQTVVDNNLNKGDCIKIQQKSEAATNSSIVQVAIPTLLLIGSIITVQMIPQVQNKGAATALAVVASIVVTQYAIKLYDKKNMKKNSTNFIVGEKYNPR